MPTPPPVRGPPRRVRSRAVATAEGQVRLCCERCDPDPRKVEAPLVDDEAALPAREELLVEMQQVVELEAPLHPQEGATLEFLQRRQLALRGEQRRERREVQRDAFDAVRARPYDRLR